MTDYFVLDWAIMAVSFFNTILLLWLGLTVLLNAERRRNWGVWLSSGGLLVGGAFFFSHSITLGDGLNNLIPSIYLWWYLDLGWIPVAALPFAWYVVMLWYAGFWQDQSTALYRRHRIGLFIPVLLAAFSLGLLLLFAPSSSFIRLTQLQLSTLPAIAGVPTLALTFPLYLVLCIGLSLDTLRHPAPSGRMMGDGSARLTGTGSARLTRTLARRRARPWLIATSLLLLVVSLLVTWGVLWVALNARAQTLYTLFVDKIWTVARFDLLVSGIIGLTILTLGQAIVAYEVFTGKTLPRRGLRRYWRNAVILAAGYSVAVGLSQLLAALLVALFYALASWRAYAERERYIQQLRPFVASQRLYDQLVAPSAPPLADARPPFRALCDDVLGTRMAHLVALGPLAPLVGPPLSYPDDAPAPPPALVEMATRFRSPQTMCVLLDDSTWAVPLWSERGLIGVLLLGEKRDGGLYTQEEIEIARASGERLIDTQASAEMARRLMALQRQRLAESQVLDRRARRALHDEVLPRLHTAMLTLGNSSLPQGGTEGEEDALSLLAGVHRQISDLLREMPVSTAPQVACLGLFGALRQAVDEELSSAFDRVTWRVEPEAEGQTQDIPSLTAEVLFYAAREAVRNAACHARDDESAQPLCLDIFAIWRDGLQIYIEDNGVGLGAAGTSGAGSGHGLALHGTMMAVVGGSLVVESVPGTYTRVTLALPANSGQQPLTQEGFYGNPTT